jgi:hypothetical protein
MASTPMDIDAADSPANGTSGISRPLGSSLASTSAVPDIIANFRPNKVPPRPVPTWKQERMSQLGLRPSKKTYITAASARSRVPPSSSPLKQSVTPPSCWNDSDLPVPKPPEEEGGNGDKKPREEGALEASSSDIPQLFKREAAKDGRPQPYILSLDCDDPGELLMTSESDETIQIYKVREGRHDKQLLSKKYGVKHAKFTHNSSSIVYASTKVNGMAYWDPCCLLAG